MSDYSPIAEIISKNFDGVFLKYESPIEIKMVGALQRLGVKVKTQVSIGPYRADVYLDYAKPIVVECDGEEYHQDKERDRKRDAYMRSKGIDVYRFTGSEICRDSMECALEVAKWIPELKGSELLVKFSQEQQDRQEAYYLCLGKQEEEDFNNY